MLTSNEISCVTLKIVLRSVLLVQVAWRSCGWTTSQWTSWMPYGSRRWRRAVRCCKMKKRMRRKRRRKWKKMREGQQQLWQQHRQWNKTTVRTTSVDEAASACHAPGQGITRVAVDPDGEDATVNKVTFFVNLLGGGGYAAKFHQSHEN